FPGYPFPLEEQGAGDDPVDLEEQRTGGDLVYVAMGTILNKDVELYRTCIGVLSQVGYRAILSVGSKVDMVQLGPMPASIRAAEYVDQRAVLTEAALFITRGGMASVHEAIHTLTPMIVIPVIPEQQMTAERIQELGIGIVLPPGQVTGESLQSAIRQILTNRQGYIERIKALQNDEPVLSVPAKARGLLQDFFRSAPPAGKTLVDLFLSQAERIPDAIALRCGDKQLTYGQLHGKTNKLAHYLSDLGIGSGVAAVVVLEPCLEMLVAILGILKAGGCYIPADPEYPPERIDYVLKDSACAVVLSKRTVLEKCRLQTAPALVLLDEPIPQPATASGSCPVSGPSAADPAYIMYTSGSTGRPKGVIVEHGQIYRYITDVHRRLQLEECASYAILGTFSADAGLTAVFSALCYGKLLHIVDIKAFTSITSLTRYFRQSPVDCYKITPSLLARLLANEGGHAILPVKRLLLGGEACPRTLANTLYTLLPPGCRLFNHYGPTETTVGVTTYAFPDRVQDLPAMIPLGKPLPAVLAHVLDQDGGYVPAGDPGELYIEGSLIARGYLNNPDLTHQKFTTIVLSGQKRRLYRTGDWVRRLPDGNLEYLGRMDHQVKILGNRIELQEVEEVILASGIVQTCVVLAKENRQGSPYLAAYIQPRQGFEKDKLLRSVRAKLPSFMVPGSWIPMEEWPLTLNNKIDRLALPDPEKQEPSNGDTLFPAGGEIEPVLLDIWMQLLGVPQIGPRDDFFQLGGNSLQLLQLSFEIHNRLSIGISAAELFDYSTLERLSARLSETGRPILPPANPAAEGFDRTEATLAQRNFFIQNKLYPLSAFPNSSLTCEILGELDRPKLEKALLSLINRNESLRTSYHLSKGKVHSSEDAVSTFQVEYLQCLSNEIDREILEAVRPFTLSQAPLIRVLLFELRNTRKYLHLYLPHINSDGESLKLIMRDLETQYNDALPAERQQFGYFLEHTHAYFHSGHYEEDEAFWARQLHADIPPLHFNFDHPGKNPGPAKLDGVFAVVPFPENFTAALQRYQKEKNSTKFQVLFISFFLLLYKISSVDDLTVLLPVHGRDKKGFEGIIGLLSNVIPVRLRFDPGQGVTDCIQSCKRAILLAISHQQYPFELIHRIWAKKGRRSTSLRQSFFGYHDHRREYTLGSTPLKIYIPERDKEDLPLSAAIFETSQGLTMRISSTAGGFNGGELRRLTDLYFTIAAQLIESEAGDTVGSLLEQAELSLQNS
ncbi:MAG TPA: amino acid adenylation domain-containing protein, partial [Puia sp.]|nr:amino acid adenylation domain-containing protein [Puia sp.]